MGFVARKRAYPRGPERPLNAVHPCERRVKTRTPPDSQRRGLGNPQWECQELWIRGLRTGNAWGPAEVPHGTSAATSAAFFYDAAFAHTMTRGLVPAILGQVTVLSLIRVTGILRGPQYPITSTSFWLHSPLHAAAVQSRRITRMAFSAAPGGTAGPCAP
jgi:hypothetical protein